MNRLDSPELKFSDQLISTTAYTMAGAAEGADLAVVDQLLHNNMLFVSMDIDVNLKLVKRVIGPMFRFCRSIYFCSRNECVLDVVPRHKDTLEQIKSYAGINIDRKRQFKVRISEADSLFGPEFFTDYAFIDNRQSS